MTFVLNRGSFHFLMDPSGVVKILPLRLMCLALKSTRGLITLFGRDISSVRRLQPAGLRQEIGVIFFQDCRLLAPLSMYDNMALPTLEHLTADILSGTLFALRLAPAHWATISPVPFLLAALTMIRARVAVHRSLAVRA
jgi:ABC-type transporter Mla maintaining outer membrane lipid asymmetry ATPase subunit MlaF